MIELLEEKNFGAKIIQRKIILRAFLHSKQVFPASKKTATEIFLKIFKVLYHAIFLLGDVFRTKYVYFRPFVIYCILFRASHVRFLMLIRLFILGR